LDIPLYTSGPDRDFSYADIGTQRIRVLKLLRVNPVCVESYKIRNNKAWALKTSGRAAGISPQHSAARGAIAGMLLGAGLWGVILVSGRLLF
jgi:hypothetical protein